MKPIVFELCAETLHACSEALPGGADRIELCVNLEVGGLTPPREMVAAALRNSGLPLHVLLRRQAESFVYTEEDFVAIATTLREVKALGAAGVVFGFLKSDLTVDVEHTRELVRMAAPMDVTFHRAFDETPDKEQALEDVIATGAVRVLTSGGAPDVLTGAAELSRLVAQAAGRIEVAVGGGLTLDNAREVGTVAGARHYHASLRNGGSDSTLSDRIRTMVNTLSDAVAVPR